MHDPKSGVATRPDLGNCAARHSHCGNAAKQLTRGAATQTSAPSRGELLLCAPSVIRFTGVSAAVLPEPSFAGSAAIEGSHARIDRRRHPHPWWLRLALLSLWLALPGAAPSSAGLSKAGSARGRLRASSHRRRKAARVWVAGAPPPAEHKWPGSSCQVYQEEEELKAAKQGYQEAVVEGNREEEAWWANVIDNIHKRCRQYVEALR